MHASPEMGHESFSCRLTADKKPYLWVARQIGVLMTTCSSVAGRNVSLSQDHDSDIRASFFSVSLTMDGFESVRKTRN